MGASDNHFPLITMTRGGCLSLAILEVIDLGDSFFYINVATISTGVNHDRSTTHWLGRYYCYVI
jgi:hypothetical protein